MISLTASAQRSIDDEWKEIQRFEKQIEAVAGELEMVAEILKKDSFVEECEIFKMHILMLNDPVFHHRGYELISRNRVRADVAVEYVDEEQTRIFVKL
jgi:phosphoenolpyruvate-protein kinase (PTS system EI component)